MLRLFVLATLSSQLLLPILGFSKPYKTQKMTVDLKVIKKGFDIPWALEFIDDNNLLISERSGSLKLLNLTNKKVTSISGLPTITVRGQGGLLDLEKHPQFANNKLIYITYSIAKDGRYSTALARAKLETDKLVDLKTIFIANAWQTTSHHFGSRLAFDHNGKLYMTIGDRGKRHDAQKLDNHQGKVLRLNDNGTAYSANPFVKTKGALPEIYSYGYRNPQGIAYDPKTKTIWVSEHGPKGGDEINFILPGRNYGWPLATHGKEYSGGFIAKPSKEGLEDPVKVYVPSIAPSSLLIYRKRMFPQWDGDFFQGALVLQHLNRVVISGRKAVSEERLLEQYNERIRSLAVDSKGSLFLGSDSGKIIQISKLPKK